jgi:hypothetical protein
MAVDWRKLALQAILADGKVDETEAKLLRKELWSGGKVDAEGLDFLVELRSAASRRAKASGEALTPAFDKLFFSAVEGAVVGEGGTVGADKVAWLRSKVLGGGKKIDPGKIDAGSKAFLDRLHKKVKEKGPELEQFFKDAGVGAAPAKAPAK